MKNHKSINKSLEAIVHQVKDVAAMLWHKGWAEANAGNLSIDVTDISMPLDEKNNHDLNIALRTEGYANLKGRRLLITGSGCRFRDISKDPESGMCLIQISQDGSTYSIIDECRFNKNIRPTSELATHLLLHDHFRKINSNYKVVIHTHPAELVALSHMKRFWSEDVFNSMLHGMLPEVKVVIPKGAGLVDYALPGSEKLAESTLEKIMKGFRIVIWQKHGCLAVSDSPVSGFDTIDILNKGAQVLLACLNAGETPEGLSETELAELKHAFNLSC
ncbi:MAG TPA: rhamnulose-1-phosphate aldolase [Desulfomonilia bacterium]